MNKRICLVHYSSAPGGIEVLMPGIIRMLPEMDFSVFVIRPPVKGEPNVYGEAFSKVTYGSTNNFIAAFRLWRFIGENRSSIFHGFNTGPFFMLVIRLAGIERAVYSIRGTLHYSSSLQKKYRRAVWRMAIAKSYRLIANSAFSRETFIRFTDFRGEDIKVLYNPVSSDRLNVADKEPRRSFTIIYVGRLTEGKNLFRWIEVAVAIHKVHSDATFILYGDGPLRAQLSDHVFSLRAEEYITFRGYVENIDEVYRQADLMLFLSEYESFGNVAVESILCGTPVIASDIPSLREIFSHFPQFLVTADDHMEEEIFRKINNLGELNKMVPVAAEEFRERFSIERHISLLRQTYNSFDDSSLHN